MARKAADEQLLTARQREWLRHLRACRRSGKRVKDYAAEHGIPVQGMYQAAKRLRKQGVIEPSGRRVRRPQALVRVALAPPPAEPRGAAWRIRLAGGAVFESTTPLAVEEIATLLERLERLR